MKRLYELIVIVLCVMCMEGAMAGAESIDVYYAGQNRLFRDGLESARDSGLEINITHFDSMEEMQTILSTELLSGQGPDVILIDEKGGLDVQRMARSGALLDLTTAFEADVDYDAGAYFPGMLAAGKLESGQYAVPLSFALPHFLTSKERLSEMNIKEVENISFQEMLELLKERAGTLAGDPERALLSVMTRRTDVTYLLCQSAGLTFLDGQGNVMLDWDAFSHITGLVRDFYDSLPALQSVTKRYRNDFVNAVGRIDFLLEDYQLASNMRYYDTYYSLGLVEEMAVLPISDYTNGELYIAQITKYGVISAQSDQPEKAYQLLRYLMDYDASAAFSRFDVAEALDIPVRIDLALGNITSAQASSGGRAMISGKRQEIPALNPNYGEQIADWYNKVGSAYLPNGYVGALVEECMTPYYTGQADYENCCRQLENALWLYANE